MIQGKRKASEVISVPKKILILCDVVQVEMHLIKVDVNWMHFLMKIC